MLKRLCMIAGLLIGACVLAFVGLIGFRQYRIAQSRAFAEAVAALQPETLREFAMQCDRLGREATRAKTNLSITDVATLSQFALLGKSPYRIFADENFVAVNYIKGHWSYSTFISWGEGRATNSTPILALELYCGMGRYTLHEQVAATVTKRPVPPEVMSRLNALPTHGLPTQFLDSLTNLPPVIKAKLAAVADANEANALGRTRFLVAKKTGGVYAVAVEWVGCFGTSPTITEFRVNPQGDLTREEHLWPNL